MKFVIIATLVALAFAETQLSYAPPGPSPSYGAPAASSRSESIQVAPPVAILRDDREQDDDGTFNFEFEAENGIIVAQSGSPDGDEDAVVKTGQYSYTAPDGSFVEVKYVADENGFQPESDILPVAPEFPHPIPQFVLDQIAKAAEEDAADSREATASARSNQYADPQPPSTSYGQPQ